MAVDKHRLFEQLMGDMLSSETVPAALEDCMSFNQDAIRHITLRNRLIALGFVRKMTLDELNDNLSGHNCPRLYARNFWEATLIYAFGHGMSYAGWQELRTECGRLYEESSAAGAAAYFTEKKLIYGELERYVLENSDSEGELLETRALTHAIDAELRRAEDEESLMAALKKNIYAFSRVREKTRYYFCKYLYYYLNTRIEAYFEACRRDAGIDDALSDLLSLKCVTALRRKKGMPEEEKRKLIHESAISCGELFDEFSYFYFDYVSVDWVSILVEYYGDVSAFPASQKKRLAETFRRKKSSLKGLTDDQVLAEVQKEIRAREEKEDLAAGADGNKGYDRNRGGERALYKYIKGTCDLERTTFVCFLLFFAGTSTLPEEHALTSERLDDILTESGFAELRSDDDFDGFVDEFLNAEDPMELLLDEIVSYARMQENSFIYNIYGGSVSYEDELEETLFG